MEMEWYLRPKYFPVWIRKKLPFAREFSAPARVHDCLYSFGGSERERLKADRMFLRMMVSKDLTVI